MSAADLADLLTGRYAPPSAGTGDIGFHQGVVTAWNSATGENTISVAGGTVSNIDVLTTSDSIMLTVGDGVGLLRVKSTYFILGRIAPPGGGAALGIRAAEVATDQGTSSTTFTDLATVGPTLTDVYIGSSRRCLVFLTALLTVPLSDTAIASFVVSGASSIVASATRAAYGQAGADGPFNVVSGTFVLLTAAQGLNQGLNTFQMKYRTTSGATAGFRDRRLAVFPF